jgi:hypothetical protein
MLCNSIGQLQLSAGCSEYCRMHRACTGFVQHGNTAKYRLQACLTASTHANRHAIFECSAALTVQLRLFAIYSGCRMHRVCAACLETQVQPARSTTDATLSNRCSDLLACWAACLVLMQVFAASCWLLRCYCLHRVCAQANTARYSLLGMFDRVNTRKQACTYIRAPSGFYNSNWSAALSAGCSECMHRGLCSMPSQPGTACSICLMGPTHRNRHTSMRIVATRAVQLHLLAISWFCVVVLFLAAQGLCATCCVATQEYSMVCLTASTREQACTYIPLCFAALIVQLQLRSI